MDGSPRQVKKLIILHKMFSPRYRILRGGLLLLSACGVIGFVIARVLAQGSNPDVTLNLPAEVLIGSPTVSFTVTFDNPGGGASTGYGPFIDVVLDTTGADGDDGLGTSTIQARYAGTLIASGDFYSVPFLDDGFGNIVATHPFLVDSTGNLVVINAATINPGIEAGDRLVVVRLPFGSFTPDQPPATITYTVNLSAEADLATPLNVYTRGGYEFGFTPLNDWCCGDAPWPDAVCFWESDSITPTLFTLQKAYNGPENETATGENFIRRYTVTAVIAPGQTISNFQLTDTLPDNVQFVSMVTPGAGSCSSLPSTLSPGGVLSCDFASASGTVTMSFNFYIPRLYDAPNPPDDDFLVDDAVIDPVTGNDAFSCNNVLITDGTWTPVDTGDDPVDFSDPPYPYDPAGCEHTLANRSIALQKEVAVIGGGDPAPTRVMEYTLHVQISDFFAFNGVTIADAFSDGQHWNTAFTPQLQINGNGFTLAENDIDLANYTVDESQIGNSGPNPPADGTDGSTTVTFNVSDELIRRATEIAPGDAQNLALAGRLLGGCVPLSGSASPDCGAYNNDGTTLTIRFQVVVQRNFTDTYPSGDSSVDQGDELTNDATVSGNVLRTSDFAAQGTAEDDDSATIVSIGRGELTKSIYAVNGNTSPPIDPASGKVVIKPSDTITYRLVYTLTTSDVENLRLEDYLPLPIFDVDDTAWSFSSAGGIPLPGVVTLGPTDTFYAYMADGLDDSGSPPDTDNQITGSLTPSTYNPGATLNPVVTADSASNFIRIAYANYSDTRHLPRTVDLLFTVTVSSDPFADRLYLTNQGLAYEGSTNAGTVDATSIIQVLLTEPVVVSTKGIVASDNGNAVFDPSPAFPASIVFNSPGSSPSWSGHVYSSDLASTPIDSNIGGVDAGDRVTFAIVIENQGSSASGAFDIVIRDAYPGAAFQEPAGGYNLQVRYGDGSAGPAYTQPDDSAAVEDNLFSTGIKLVDPDPDHGACQAESIGPGLNIIIITYDLQLRSDVVPGVYTNSSALVNYAGTEDGPNHLPEEEEDEADTETATPLAVKIIDHTEISNLVNDDTEAVIGEFLYYKVTLTIPEGYSPGAGLVDTLDTGLVFVACDSITPSANVSTDLINGFAGACTNPPGPGPSVGSGGREITFNLGNITNADTDNDQADTIEIVYQVIVDNVGTNTAGGLRNNSAVYSWNSESLAPVSAPDITILEPDLTNTKTAYINHGGGYVDSGSGDAGDPVRYVIVLGHAAGAYDTDAFDVTFSDPFPTGPGGVSLIDTPSIVSVTGGVAGIGDFELAGDNATGWTLQTLSGSSFDFPLGSGPVTITVEGTLSYSAYPYATINNTGTVRWTSLDGTYGLRSSYGTNPTERTGTGTIPDMYYETGADSFTTISANPVKSRVSTSESHTANQYLAIGEIVRYRLTVLLPEGTTLSYAVRDNLPNYLLFLEDGTAMVAFVSDEGDPTCATSTATISSSSGTLGTSPWQCGNETSLAFIIPTHPFELSDVTSNPAGKIWLGATNIGGTDPIFNLGALSNTDNDANNEYVVIEFNALMMNITNNQAGGSRSNTAIVFHNGATAGSNSNSVAVIAAEPVVTIAKTVTTAPQDAGDAVQYTLTITNTSTGAARAAAFELMIADTVSPWVNLESVVVAGPTGFSYVDSSTLGTGGTVNVSVVRLNPAVDISSGPTAVTITINGHLLNNTPGGLSITNTGTVTYTSLPDEGTPAGSNPTGSQTPGVSGAIYNGERTGDDGVGGTLNDYADDDQIVTDLFAPAIEKIAVSPTGYTIGQTVTYTLRITLPEGVTEDIVVTDLLPAGLAYQSYEVITSAALSGGLLTADFNGSLPAPSAGTPPPGASGQDLVLTFGDTTVTQNGDASDDRFLVRLTVLVLNVFENQNGDVLPNQGRLSYTSPNPPNATVDVDSNIVNITVIEPVVDIDKHVLTYPAPPDAGGTIVYEIVLDHNTASAYAASDARYTDTLPIALDLNIGSISITPAGGAVIDANNSSDNTVDIRITSIPLGGSVTITYSALLTGSVQPDSRYTNTGTVVWTSLSGASADERASGDGFWDNDDGGGTALNDYARQDDAYFDTGQAVLAKDIIGTSSTITSGNDATIGERVTFQIRVFVPEGTTDLLEVTDHLPAGMECVPSTTAIITAAVSGNPPYDRPAFDGTLPAGTLTCPSGNGADPAFTWANVVVTADNDPDDNYFDIQFDAIVLDVPGNIGYGATPTELDNYASISINSGTPVDSDTETVRVAEPHLTVVKTITPDRAADNDTVTFAITVENDGLSQANDFILDDVLPNARFDTISSVSIPSGFNFSTVPSGTDTIVRISGASLPAGESRIFEFSARVVNLPVGVVFTNTATVTDHSTLPGTVSGEREEPDVSGSDDLTGIAPDIVLTKTSPLAQYTPGDTIVYTLQVQNAGERDAENVLVTETVPPNSVFSSAASLPTAWSCSDGSTAGTTCTLTLAALDAGDTINLSFAVTVVNPLPAGVDSIANTASAYDDGTHGTDTTPANNEDTETDDLIAAPDLVIVKTDGGTTNAPGGIIVYTITYRNDGNQNATGVEITETVPAETTFRSSESVPTIWSCTDGSAAGTNCTVVIGNLASGAGGTLTFAVQVNNPVSAGVTQITNTTSIADDGTNGTDTTPEDNSSTDNTPVTAGPDLTVTKTDGVSQVASGSVLTYTIVITNNGDQGSTGIVLIDTIPDYTTYLSSSTGGTYNSGSRTVTWPSFGLAAGNNQTFTVTVRVDTSLPPSVNSIVNRAVVSDDGVNGADTNPTDNEASDMDIIGSGGKNLVGHNLPETVLPEVAIGETLTYQTQLVIGRNTMLQDLTLTDTLDRGLVFVRCEGITSTGGTLNLSPAQLQAVCNSASYSLYPAGSGNPADAGRRAVFSFGALSNLHLSEDTVLVVEYTVVVLNNAENYRGIGLNNEAFWSWTGGRVDLTTNPVTIVEPDITLLKEAGVDTVLPGEIVTFTLTISHSSASDEDAYDLLVEDTLPSTLIYVPGSLQFISGQDPGPAGLDESAAPTLRIRWDQFQLGMGPTVIQFQAQVNNTIYLPPGTSITNTARAEWSSMPGDFITPQSAHNPLSTERYYDPGSSINGYVATSSDSIRTPSLPDTGFAPGRVTDLPLMPDEFAYDAFTSLSLNIPLLNVNLPIVGVPLIGGEWDLTWLGSRAGYLEGTAFPTWKGNSAITAHVYDAYGNPGPFHRLHILRWGDPVHIDAFGLHYTYEVREVRKVSPTNLSPLKHENASWLTLLTCQGYNENTDSYKYRIAVRAVLIKIESLR